MNNRRQFRDINKIFFKRIDKRAPMVEASQGKMQEKDFSAHTMASIVEMMDVPLRGKISMIRLIAVVEGNRAWAE